MQETILVPARTISDFYVRIKNSEQKQGFIPRLHLYNEVYLGNAVVSNNNNNAYMKIFNTNTQPQKLTIPTVELIDFEKVSIHEEKQTNPKTNLGDRKEFYVPPARKLVFSLQLTVAQCSTLRYKGMKCKN